MTQAKQKTRFNVGGMDCASCATKIENAVTRLPGVDEVSVSVQTGGLTVTHDETLQLQAVEKQVKKLGYTISSTPSANTHNDHDGHNHSHDHSSHSHISLGDGPWWKSSKATLTMFCGLALGVATLAAWLMPAASEWLFLAAMAVGLIPIARRAFAAAVSGTPFSIEMLMTIAAVGAVFIGAQEEAAAVVFLFLVGELLEGVAASRARSSIRGLTALVPKTAFVEENGTTREMPAETLAPGMVILVRPGDRIAADGEIIEGESAIDEAPVTGESTPKQKQTGDTVFAGTINGSAVLRIRVTAAAEDNTIARVVKLVEEAQESKAPTERFIDRFSKYYTPAVLAVGALVAILPPLLWGGDWSEWIYKGLAVLLIGCPCALVISTPAAIAAGLSSGAKRGLLIKGGAVLEGLRDINTVALDKTGTLTEGKPVVTNIVGHSFTEPEVLSLAASLETGSSHPLALAVLSRAQTDNVTIPVASNASAIAGKGVTGTVEGKTLFLASPRAAQEIAALPADFENKISAFNDEGKTVSVLLVDNEIAGMLAIRDEPRADAKSGLRALEQAGISTIMLTGDNARTAAAIGSGLGIEVRAGLLPQDKQRIVRELQSSGRVVAKVGDGINDAPALAAADIGIAMGGGTDVALETADAAILHGRVSDIANMVFLSRSVMSNITQNIAIALGLKAVFLVTTIVGITGLWPAILADTGATVLVTINALRLLGTRYPHS